MFSPSTRPNGLSYTPGPSPSVGAVRLTAKPRSILAASLFLVGMTGFTSCGVRSQSAAVMSAKLTPEEQGASEFLKPRIDFIVSKHAIIEESTRKYNEYKAQSNSTLADSESKRFFGAHQELGNFLQNLKANQAQQPTLMVPTTMSEILGEIRAFEGLRFTIASANLTDQDRASIKAGADRVVAADLRLAALWNARTGDYSATHFSNSLTIEYPGFPVKLDFVSGEVKVKYAGSLGPFKLTAQSGPSSRSGIKTLIVQNQASRRYFAVGGRPIHVHVPESLVTTNGDTMTITALR